MDSSALSSAIERYREHLEDCKDTIYADMGFDKEMYRRQDGTSTD